MHEIIQLHVLVASSHTSCKNSVGHVSQKLDDILFHQLHGFLHRLLIVSKSIHHGFKLVLEPKSIPLVRLSAVSARLRSIVLQRFSVKVLLVIDLIVPTELLTLRL